MTATPTAAPLRVTGSGSLIALVPHLLGYTPSGIVAATLNAGRIKYIARIDADAYDEDEDLLAAAIFGNLRDVDAVILIGFDTPRVPTAAALAALVARCPRPVVNVLRVADGAWSPADRAPARPGSGPPSPPMTRRP